MLGPNSNSSHFYTEKLFLIEIKIHHIFVHIKEIEFLQAGKFCVQLYENYVLKDVLERIREQKILDYLRLIISNQLNKMTLTLMDLVRKSVQASLPCCEYI